MMNKVPESPLSKLMWLSERNSHIPVQDLAYLLGVHLTEHYPFDFDDEDKNLDWINSNGL